MGYVAVRGGQVAIEASLDLLEWERVCSGHFVDIKDILTAFPELIDQIMGESSLYAPELAALALKQAQGSPEEAVFLLRAFRSTLERPHISRVSEPSKMSIKRRISAAFKDVPGGQLLGATRDYSHRLLDFSLSEEDEDDLREIKEKLKLAWEKEESESQTLGETLPKVADYLRAEGLLDKCDDDDSVPTDITMEPLVFPAPRSARLQTLARGMTQAVTSLGYAAIRGFGLAHPTVAELRYGDLEVTLDRPNQAGSAEDAYYVGSLPVTEVESLFSDEKELSGGQKELSLDLGYGMILGRGETKAIAMSVLDRCLMQEDKQFPTQDEEFVLYHVDAIESTGFVSHLKLPHYVTFQSHLSSIRETRKTSEKTKRAEDTVDGQSPLFGGDERETQDSGEQAFDYSEQEEKQDLADAATL